MAVVKFTVDDVQRRRLASRHIFDRDDVVVCCDAVVVVDVRVAVVGRQRIRRVHDDRRRRVRRLRRRGVGADVGERGRAGGRGAVDEHAVVVDVHDHVRHRRHRHLAAVAHDDVRLAAVDDDRVAVAERARRVHRRPGREEVLGLQRVVVVARGGDRRRRQAHTAQDDDRRVRPRRRRALLLVHPHFGANEKSQSIE